MKSLVVYFSHSGQNWFGGGTVNLVKGNTEFVAEYIRELTGADLFKIETEKDYPKDYDECTNVAKQELSKDEELLLISNLLSHYFFHRISKEILTFLIKEIKVFQIEENSTIFFEGDEGSCLFIIKSGEIKLTSEKGNKILILKDGNIFGELAILKERIIRTYTAIALTNISFYFLDETSFNIVKDNFIYNIQSDFELFLNLDKNVKENLEYLTVQIEVKKGNVISQLNCLFEILLLFYCLNCIFDLFCRIKNFFLHCLIVLKILLLYLLNRNNRLFLFLHF